MNGNAELLNYVYQNSQMGVDTLKQLKDITEDAQFKAQLESEYNEYSQMHVAARKALNESGLDEKGIGTMEKIKTYLVLNMQTMSDKSPSHIAEMLIIGSNMGVVNAIRSIKKYQNAEPAALGQMDRLLKFEENNIQQLKAFL